MEADKNWPGIIRMAGVVSNNPTITKYVDNAKAAYRTEQVAALAAYAKRHDCTSAKTAHDEAVKVLPEAAPDFDKAATCSAAPAKPATPQPDANALAERASGELGKGDFKKALDDADAALAKDPKNLTALDVAARAACSTGDPAMADRAKGYLAKLEPNDRVVAAQVCKDHGIKFAKPTKPPGLRQAARSGRRPEGADDRARAARRAQLRGGGEVRAARARRRAQATAKRCACSACRRARCTTSNTSIRCSRTCRSADRWPGRSAPHASSRRVGRRSRRSAAAARSSRTTTMRRSRCVAPRDAAKPPADARPPQPARSEHAVFELVDNRHAAHRAVDGEVVIDASDIGFARFIRFGLPAPRWHLGQDVDGERAAIADRLASLERAAVARADARRRS